MDKYKLVIFDMDGTLLNTLDDLAASANYALRQKGYHEHSTEQYKEFIGHGPVHLMTQAMPPIYRNDENVKDILKIYTSYYSLHDNDLTKPYHGIPEVLAEIKNQGVKVAVYSNKPHKNVVNLCGRFFPGLIDISVGFKEGVPPKPDPAAGLKIMERFHASGSETVYIGDSGVDMLTGLYLGAYTVGVSWGFRPREELVSTGASIVVDKTEDLLGIFL